MRSFPFVPRSVRDLEIGDFWVVDLPDGRLGVLQARDLARSGPGARTVFVAGVVDWRGTAASTAAELSGRRVLAQGLTRVEVFTSGSASVLGNAPDTVPVDGLAGPASSTRPPWLGLSLRWCRGHHVLSRS